MVFLFDVVRGYARPILLAVMLVIGFSLMSDHSSDGISRSSGFNCASITSDIGVNSALCRFSLKRIWNTPVLDLIPTSWTGRDPS